MDQLTDGQLQWSLMDDPYDVVLIGDVTNGRRYNIRTGMQAYCDELKKSFPGEEKAIENFMKLVKVSVIRSS